MTEAPDDHGATLQAFEAALLELGKARYELTLFVNGASARSARAVADLRALCDIHLRDRYALHVIDVHLDPDQVTRRGVLAAPTLIKELPLPKRILVGNLSDVSRVLLALDIEPTAASRPGDGSGVD